MSLSLFDDNVIKPNRTLFLFSECKKGLHSYFKSPFRNENNQLLCRNCKTAIVDWALIKERNLNNIQLISSEIRKEWWRNYWWEIEIDEIDLLNARKFSLEKININVEKRIKNSVGKVYDFKGKFRPYNDGYQTPYKGNIIFYGQHAMATCCRFCIEYWHGIPQGRSLTETEVKYLSELTIYYIRIRLCNDQHNN